MYVSSESHHSLLKAARLCGIGSEAVRQLVSMNICGCGPISCTLPLPRIATRTMRLSCGSHSGRYQYGCCDDLTSIAKVAADQNLWYHVDAAWGGLRCSFRNSALNCRVSNSRLDHLRCAIRWLSVPMGAGMYMTRHAILDATFRVQTAYMPKDAEDSRA